MATLRLPRLPPRWKLSLRYSSRTASCLAHARRAIKHEESPSFHRDFKALNELIHRCNSAERLALLPNNLIHSDMVPELKGDKFTPNLVHIGQMAGEALSGLHHFLARYIQIHLLHLQKLPNPLAADWIVRVRTFLGLRIQSNHFRCSDVITRMLIGCALATRNVLRRHRSKRTHGLHFSRRLVQRHHA